MVMEIELGTTAKRSMRAISQLRLSPYILKLEISPVHRWETLLYILEAGVVQSEERLHTAPGALLVLPVPPASC